MKKLFFDRSDIREKIYLVLILAVYCAGMYFLKLGCPIYFMTGISCPGCGMTRALVSILHFDFGKAVYYHPLIYFCFIMFPALFFVSLKKKKKAKKILIAIFVVTFIVTYLYRLLVLKSPVLHFKPENGIFVKIFMKVLK